MRAKALRDELHARVNARFDAPDLGTACTLLANVVADYEPCYPHGCRCIAAELLEAASLASCATRPSGIPHCCQLGGPVVQPIRSGTILFIPEIGKEAIWIALRFQRE
jgi:hypothetical protein